MRAILMNEPGGPEVLNPGEIPAPEIETESQMRVRLQAAGVNPVDTKLRARGTYYPDRLPAILGCDGAGVVEAVGPAVTRFRPGDAVFFCHGGIGQPPGTYAQYAVIEEDFAARKPNHASFAEAAAAPLVCIVAWEALHDRARIHAHQRVLVHAGAGGVGHIAIQLAKAADCEVVTTVGSGAQAAFVSELGADHIINYKETDPVESILEWTEGKGVDAAVDTVGGETFEKTFPAVRPYGDLVTLLQPSPETDWKIARLRNLRISLELMLSPMYFGWREAQRHQAHILEQCAGLMESKKLRVALSREFPMEAAADAHRLLEAGGMTGKIALLIE